MLEEYVKTALKKSIDADYPYLKLPPIVYATVSTAKKLAETYEAEELIIHNDESGGSYRGHITASWYEYVLRVVDRFGSIDEDYPPMPGVKSKKQFKTGALVAISLPYGDLTPAIIGEVSL